MNRSVIKTVIVHMLTLAFMITACSATAFGVSPFGFSAHLAVLYSGGLPLASLYFLVASMLASPTLTAFCVSASLSVVGVIANLIITFAPIMRKKTWRMIAHSALQTTGYGVFLYLFGAPRIIAIVSALLGILLGILMSFATPALASGVTRIDTLGKAGLSAVCVVFFMGIEGIKIVDYPVARLIFALFTLAVISCRGNAFVLGALASFGSAVASGSTVIMACGVMSAFGAMAFGKGARILPALAMPLAYFAVACLFSYSLDVVGWEMLAMGCGCVAYVLLPKKVIKGVADYFRPIDALTLEISASGMGRKLPERLIRASEALGEMSELLGADARADGGVGMRVAEALQDVCLTCEKCDTCAVCADMTALAEDFVLGGARLKNNVISMPCSCGGRLLRVAGEIKESLAGKLSESESERRSASSYAKRLSSLKKLIGKISAGVVDDYRYDGELSEKVRNNLPDAGLPCGGALVTAKLCGVVLVPTDTSPETLEKSMRKIIGNIRVDRTDEVTPSWTAMSFSRASALDVVYAVAQSPKPGNKASGDSYSATLCDNRALLSLCDGSGTGKSASRLSQATLSLIESHYKAGFDASDGIASVNSFLSSRASEEFSALDVVSINLENGEADILKAGTPSTYVIHGDSLTKIDGSALPVGALEKASYALATKRLTAGDVVILTSDGVSDALPDLPEIISAQSRINVRRMADGILAEAERRSSHDDMSVLVARLIVKN